ncbi:MAG: septation protein SpoVG family protein [Chloroflexi bacterium]|nr:septation protein SpoVG family protein [Chloroflexota bacterium]
MKSTEVNVNLRDEERLKAFVNITFDDVFVIRGLKVIEGQRGLFVCMPSRRLDDGSHRDIAHPISNEFRQEIEDQILAEYDRLAAGQAPGTARSEDAPQQGA